MNRHRLTYGDSVVHDSCVVDCPNELERLRVRDGHFDCWRASKNPKDWQSVPVDSVVKRWWFFWLAYCFLGNAAFRASLAAHTADALHMATVVSVVADAAGLLSGMVVLTMTREIYTMQMNKVREALPI